MNPKGEKFVTRMLTFGITAMLAGGLFFVLLFVGGIFRMVHSQGDVTEVLYAMPGIVLFLGGLALVAIGIFTGLKYSAGRSDNTRHLPEAVIVSRFAVNSLGEMIFGNFEYEAPGGKLYVQMRMPDGSISEFRTAWGVFCQCGEGMRGAALVKGSWLASFAPIIAQADALRNPDFSR